MPQRANQALRRDTRRIPVVEVRGEIDLSTIKALDETLDEAILAFGPQEPQEDGNGETEVFVEPPARPCVVMNLSPTRFMDSEGLSAMIGYRGALRSLGGELLVVARPGPVLDLLKTAGVDHLFKLYGTLGEALDVAEARCGHDRDGDQAAAKD